MLSGRGVWPFERGPCSVCQDPACGIRRQMRALGVVWLLGVAGVAVVLVVKWALG